MPRILFITGTDTGVGKTLLTALLLAHGRLAQRRVHAIKPFCSGPPSDVKLFESLMHHELTTAEINPYHYPNPVAPAVPNIHSHTRLNLNHLAQTIRRQGRACDLLLVEGIGGACVPLDASQTLLDLIHRLHAPTIIVAPNSLGTLNHSLLTIRQLQSLPTPALHLVLMNPPRPDPSTPANPHVLHHFLPQLPLTVIPYLGAQASQPESIIKNAKKLKKTLAPILDFDTFSPASPNREAVRSPGKISKKMD